MKKLWVLLLIWTFWLVTPIKSEGVIPAYKIYNDTKQSDIVKVHDEVMAIAAQLFQSANRESYGTLLQHGYHHFDHEGWQVEYRNHELIITVGDGKGEVVGGQFTKNAFCLPEVKPKSIVREWLGF